MQDRMLITAGGLMLGLLAWNTWTLGQLKNRIAGLETQVQQQHGQGGDLRSSGGAASSARLETRRSRQLQRRARVSDTGSPPAAADPEDLDLSDPGIRRAIADIAGDEEILRHKIKREERIDMYLDSVTEEVRSFANERDIEPEVIDEVLSEIEDATLAVNGIKAEVRQGDLSWFDAGPAMETVRTERENRLRELLGDESYEVLEGRIWNWRDWRR